MNAHTSSLNRMLVFAVLFLVGPSWASRADAQEVTAAEYSRAAQLLSWNTNNLILGGAVRPNWIPGSDRFWYRTRVREGHEFIVVDPARNAQGPLFDRHRLAAAMSLAADTSFVGTKLPQSFEFLGSETRIALNAGKLRFECDLGGYTCMAVDTLADARAFAVSPDSTVEVFMQKNDLYLRSFRGGDTIRLTNDGEEYFAYGAGAPSPTQLRRETPQRPQVSWAPNSRRLAVMRPDERGVELMHFISSTSSRPKHYARPYALPGDSIIPQPIFHILNLPEDLDAAAADTDSTKAHATANHQIVFEPDLWNLSFGGAVADSVWTADSETLYVNYFTRGEKKLVLAGVDAVTGEHRTIAADSGKTNVIGNNWTGPKSFWVSPDEGTVIWWSERDGWAHLYRHDAADGSTTQLTSGPWTVGTLLHVDEARRQLYFTGRPPVRSVRRRA